MEKIRYNENSAQEKISKMRISEAPLSFVKNFVRNSVFILLGFVGVFSAQEFLFKQTKNPDFQRYTLREVFVKNTVLKKIFRECPLGSKINLTGISQEKLSYEAKVIFPSGVVKKIRLFSTSGNKNLIDSGEVFIFQYTPLHKGIYTVEIMNFQNKLVVNMPMLVF